MHMVFDILRVQFLIILKILNNFTLASLFRQTGKGRNIKFI